jgi:hypothetical protein
MHGAGWVSIHERRTHARCTVTIFQHSYLFVLFCGGILASSSKRWSCWHSLRSRLSSMFVYHIHLKASRYNNLRFIHVSAANGPRRRMMGRTPFLCIMRSVGYDFGRCLHQCQDDLVHLLRPLSCLHITVCTNPGTCINLLSSNKGTRDIQPPSTACCCRSSVVGIRHQPLHSLA